MPCINKCARSAGEKFVSSSVVCQIVYKNEKTVFFEERK